MKSIFKLRTSFVHPAFSVSYTSLKAHERQKYMRNIVYTDGSKKGCVIGAGIYHPFYNLMWAYGGTFPDRSSVRAELIAINLALRLFTSSDIVILTDSSASLDLIISYFDNQAYFRYHSHSCILGDISDVINWRQAMQLSTRFYKVKAHSGIHGNTVADALAREARVRFERLSKNDIDYTRL